MQILIVVLKPCSTATKYWLTELSKMQNSGYKKQNKMKKFFKKQQKVNHKPNIICNEFFTEY